MENLPSVDPQALVPILLTILPIVFLIALIPAILLDLILHRTLARCAPSSRAMPPAQVWLSLIPVFGLFWSFHVVRAVAKTLHNEFVRRGIVADSAPGKSLGMAWATLALLSAIPLVNFVTTLPAAVCWALYCIRIASFSSRLDERAVIPG